MAISLDRFALPSAVQMADVIYLANGIDNVHVTDGLLTGAFAETMSTTAPAVGTLAAAESDVGVGNIPNGTYYYVVTYIRAAGSTYPLMESGACTEITQTVASGPSSLTLSNIPLSSDSQVTGRRIYRRGGTLSQWYLMHTLADNTTETYKDTNTDATIQVNATLRRSADAFPLKRTNSEGLPPKVEFLEVWENRLWGALNADLYWSEPKPWQEDWPSRNHEPIPIKGGVGEKATGLVTFKGRLYVFREDAVMVVERSTIGFVVNPVVRGRGSPGGHSIIPVGDNLFWLDRQIGPVMWTGVGDPVPIGIPIQDFWKDDVEKNALWRSVGTYHQERNQIIWYIQEGRYDRNNRRLVYDVLSQTWTLAHAEATAAGLVRNEVGETSVLEGTSLGDVYHYDLGTGDAAGADGTVSGPQGNLTVGGVSLTDDGASFDTSGDEIEGAPLYGYDSDGELVVATRVVEVVSGTAVTTVHPLPSTVSEYAIGGLPFTWETGWIRVDVDGPQILKMVAVEWEIDSGGATVYVDAMGDTDTAYTNGGSFVVSATGREEIYFHDRAESHKIRLRCRDVGKSFKITALSVEFLPTRGRTA